MAVLGGKSAEGILNFTKFVEQNKRFKEIDFELEKATPIFLKDGAAYTASPKTYKKGTKIRITKKTLTDFNKMRFASVAIGGRFGFIPITRILAPVAGNGTQYEDEVIDLFNEVITTNGPLDIKLKGDNTIYKGITYAVKVDNIIKSKAGIKGDPKADIILCKDKDHPLAPGSIYLSHKKAGGPEAFQQYGGISVQAGKKINQHKAVQTFLSIVADALNGTDRLPYPIVGQFKDDTLANLSIYGPDYGKSYSINHVQLIGQGRPALKAIQGGKYYELNFTSHMALSGDLNHFTGGYTPVLAAVFRSGRSFEYNGERFSGARIGVFPQKKVTTVGAGTVVFNLN